MLASTETTRNVTIRDGEPSSNSVLLYVHRGHKDCYYYGPVQVQCYFTSTETIRTDAGVIPPGIVTIRDGEPSSSSVLLYVHRDRKDH